MRMSYALTQTLRDAPADAEVASHRLLLRAGYIRQHAAGIFSYLPFGQRVIKQINAILHQELKAIGGQEMMMPVVHPAGLWQESNRWYEIGNELGRFADKNGRDLALALSHEEIVADLARREIQSYRQLPRLIYHIQTKWRDDPRPRAGLIRAREFTMKDSYTLDADPAGLDQQYDAHYRAYFNIFTRCGLPVIAVEADVGMMGGTGAHEYIYLTPIGEDTLLLCDACGYKANRQIATFQKSAAALEALQPLEKVATPETKTIAALADFLGVPTARTAKAVFLVATVTEKGNDVDRLVFTVLRGDMELNETKLGNALAAKALRPAREDEIMAVGAVPGYASPVGLEGIMVVADEAVMDAPNLVAGANEEGFHLLNVNAGRDYQPDIVTDLAAAQAGDACPECGAPMQAERGVEVANIFKLGTHYSDKMGATFVDEAGQSRPVVMGSYGIGVTRTLACIAEHHHDEYGLIWPITVAPFQVHLVALRGGFEQADILYRQLQVVGLEVLYDDRDESPGVKFNDADLIGAPIRLTIGKRSLAGGGVEMKLRHEQERAIIPLDTIVDHVQKTAGRLRAAIHANLREKAIA